jgi:hypothetical protein
MTDTPAPTRRLKTAPKADKVGRAVAAPFKPATAGQIDGKPYTVRLAARHAEYLERIARKEGRTPEQMLERLVRIELARDPTKGYAPAELGQGQAIPGSGSGAGVSGAHPAKGGGG